MENFDRPSVSEQIRLAVSGARAAVAMSEATDKRVDDHELRLAMLEDHARPSRVNEDMEDLVRRVDEALSKRRSESGPPNSGVEYKDEHGRRFRGAGWPVLVLAIAAVLTALILKGPDWIVAIQH